MATAGIQTGTSGNTIIIIINHYHHNNIRHIQWPRDLRRGLLRFRTLDRRFEFRTGHGSTFLVLLCCVVLCKSRPCDELITRQMSPTVWRKNDRETIKVDENDKSTERFLQKIIFFIIIITAIIIIITITPIRVLLPYNIYQMWCTERLWKWLYSTEYTFPRRRRQTVEIEIISFPLFVWDVCTKASIFHTQVFTHTH